MAKASKKNFYLRSNEDEDFLLSQLFKINLSPKRSINTERKTKINNNNGIAQSNHVRLNTDNDNDNDDAGMGKSIRNQGKMDNLIRSNEKLKSKSIHNIKKDLMKLEKQCLLYKDIKVNMDQCDDNDFSFNNNSKSIILSSININDKDGLINSSSNNTLTTATTSNSSTISSLKMLDEYKPIINDFDIGHLKKMNNVHLITFQDGLYYGQVKNGTKHGLGLMIYNDGKVYEGQWDQDKRHGNGATKSINGDIYQGKFKDDEPNGYGTYISFENETYEGEWTNGLKNGKGRWKGPKGESYEGQWFADKRNGHGIYTNEIGDRYEGQFKQDIKHGQGIEYYSNGDKFNGSYVNGYYEGKGEYAWANGAIYIGEFKYGLKHGKGYYKNEHEEIYEGMYENGKKNGYGEYVWKSGNHYKGHFKNDFRDGFGEIYWIDGSYYKGEWRKGIRNGDGELLIIGEKVLKGRFRNNMYLEPLENSGSVDKEKLMLELAHVNSPLDTQIFPSNDTTRRTTKSRIYFDWPEYNIKSQKVIDDPGKMLDPTTKGFLPCIKNQKLNERMAILKKKSEKLPIQGSRNLIIMEDSSNTKLLSPIKIVPESMKNLTSRNRSIMLPKLSSC